MWSTPRACASRRTLTASRRSRGGPNTFGPVSRMAPKPIGATENGPRRRLSPTGFIVRLVLQGSVEADRGVGPVAERLVLRTSAPAQRHVLAVRNLPAVDIGETHGARHEVRPVLARGDVDFGHRPHALESYAL